MHILVTGGAGFIGSHVAEKLIEQGYPVSIIDNFASGSMHNLQHIEKHKNLQIFDLDIRDRQSLQSAFKDVACVIHLAGIADIVPSIENPVDYFETNVTGTLNVLECARACGAPRIVYAASSSCYGIAKSIPTSETAAVDPQYPYALSKWMGEQLVLHWGKIYGLPHLSLRLFNVYGPRVRTNGAYGAVFGVFLAQKANNKPFTVVGDGSQTRDFTYVSDVAEAFVLAAQSKLSGEILNVGSGNHYSIRDLVGLLGGPIRYVPKRPGEPDCTFADTSKIQQLLGWQAKTSFEQGVVNMLAELDRWRDAPLWDEQSIQQATETWFKYLDSQPHSEIGIGG